MTSEFIEAGPEATALTQDCFVFDALGLPYVLEEPYTEKCLQAGVNAVNVTLTGEEGWDATLQRLEEVLSFVDNSPHLVLAGAACDLQSAREAGKLAVIPGTQGAAMVGDELWRIGVLYRLGVRFIGLAYTPANLLADGCGELRDAGLSALGREFVAAVNDWPLILDLSHTGHSSRAEAASLARAPACTHSNAFAVNRNDRNTKDEVVSMIASKGGVVGICCLPRTVRDATPTVRDLIDHCDHFAGLVGNDAVGVGLDYQQGDQERGGQMSISKRWRTLRPDVFGTVSDYYDQAYPAGVETISGLANITQELMNRGYQRTEIAAILGGNWLRFIRSVTVR